MKSITELSVMANAINQEIRETDANTSLPSWLNKALPRLTMAAAAYSMYARKTGNARDIAYSVALNQTLAAASAYAAIHNFTHGEFKNGLINISSAISAETSVLSTYLSKKGKLGKLGSKVLDRIEIGGNLIAVGLSDDRVAEHITKTLASSLAGELTKKLVINLANRFLDDNNKIISYEDIENKINSVNQRMLDNKLEMLKLKSELTQLGFDVIIDDGKPKDPKELESQLEEYFNRPINRDFQQMLEDYLNRIPDDGTIPEDQILRHDYIPVINKETGKIEMVDVGKARMQDFAKKMEDYLNDPSITRIFRNLLPSQINLGSWLDISPAAWYKLFRSAFYYQYDPLTLDLNGNGIETLAANGHDGAMFDHERLGIRTATGWIHSNDGILVYDRNGDGKINDSGEIFGDNTLLKNGKTAAHGFEAAADLDDNGDGKLDAADSAFGKLGVWRDLNHNGISEEGEIFALKDLRIKSLNLGYTQADKDLGNGNTLAEVGSYTDEDGNEHIMGDLRLSADRLHSRYSNSIPLTDEQQQEVNLRGSGRLRDLREAAAQSSELADVLQQYKNAATKEEQLALRHKLLKAWADTDPQRFEDFKSTMKTMIQSEERKGIGLTPSQVEHMNEIMVMGFWKVLGQPDPAGQKQAELNRRIAILDAFTGTRSPNLYYFSKEEAQHIVDTVNDTYERLADSLYDGLLFQTRLRPYLDAIRLRINEAGEYGIDYSGVSALFTEIHKKNPGKAFTDLGELLAKGNADGKNTAMAPLVEQFVQFAAEAEQNGTFTQYADVLGKKNLETLGHRIGGDGDDSLSGNESANYLSGGAGDDILSGGAGHDTLDGGTGNDQLYGGSEESDTYLFRAGHGKDHVSDNARNQAEADTLRFSGAQLKNAQFSREGHDLAIRAYGDAGDQVNIKDFFWYSTGKYYNLQFDDATLTKDDIAGLRIAGNGTDKGETIYGWYNADVIDAGAGDDYVYGGANNDELSGGDGNDRLYGGEGNDKLNGDSGNDELAGENGDDQLNGGEGDDTLYGGAGHDTLDGGTGNDQLYGGSEESDTYLFRAGHGKDHVSDNARNQAEADTLRFSGAQLKNAQFSREGHDLAIRAYGDAGDQVNIKDFFWYSTGKYYNLQFDDATLTKDDIAGLRIAGNGTDKDETIYGWYNADVIDAGAGDDYVYGGANNDELSGGDGNDRLYGGEGNDKLNGDSGNDELAGENGDDQLNGGEGDDTLYGGAGHDTLDGGTGNDSLNGGSYESDTYLFRAGHGKDVVSDYANKDEQADTLRFNGAKAQDAVFDRDGWNLNIKAYGSEDQVTVKDYFYSDSHSRYNFAFDDASYSVADIRSRDLLKDGLPSASVAVTEENSASQIATDAAASAQTVKEAKAEAAPASSAGTTQTAENIAAQTATETAASAQTVKEAKAETVPTTSVGTLSTEKAAVAQQAAAADRDTTATAPAKALAAQVESAGQQGGVATTDSHPVTPTTIGTQSAATASDAKAAAQAQHLIEAMAAFDTRSATADKLATPPLQQPPLAAAAADSTVKPLLP